MVRKEVTDHMQDIYEVKVQHTAGAYQTIRMFFRLKDAQDYLASIAAMNPDDPYDGVSTTYAVGSSVHHKDRYLITKNGVVGEKSLTPLKKSVKI